MGLTARQRVDVLVPPSQFIFTRGSRAIVLAAAVLGGFTAWLGDHKVSLPAAVPGGVTSVPLWQLVTMGAAGLAVLGMHSRLADLEEVATHRLHRHRHRYLTVMSLACAAIYLGLGAITLPHAALLAIGRSWPGWCGLALLAGAILGWRLAWSLPAVGIIVLTFWGNLPDGQPRWWAFHAHPYDHLPSLLVSLALLAAGVAAYLATPWRRRRLRPWRR